MIEVMYNSQASLEGPGSPYRDEHRAREGTVTRGNKRPPKRSQTQYEYRLPQPPAGAYTVYTIRQQPQIAEHPPTPTAKPSSDSSNNNDNQEIAERARTPRRRPPLGPPRRSYSVTDQQPIPHHHRPSARLTLMDLPGELHYAIFDFLDPIDSTCFGLTSTHMYAIHRRLHGTVPLTIRRDGPNNLEWAWHQAGNTIRNSSAAPAVPLTAPVAEDEKNAALLRLRVRGQAYCRMCGVTRCQLHKHVQEWMGEGFEYCSVRQKFGPVAHEGAKSYCYMSKPGDKRRCGRHFVRRTTVELR